LPIAAECDRFLIRRQQVESSLASHPVPVLKTLTASFLSLFLAACALPASKVTRVDARVAAQQETGMTCFPRESDRCALNSPVLELGRADFRDGRNHVTLIEIGENALKLRIHLLRSAREYIDVQNFILRKDITGELFLNELLAASRRGVKVRLLLDQLFSVSDLEYLVKLAMEHVNFEIRFYNPTFYKAQMSKSDWLKGTACCFRRFNQRMHNKLLVVDDVVGITGGRNIADRYYDFDTNYEFKDRDIMVYGRLAQEMRESFDWFWNYRKSVPVQHLRDVAGELLNGGSFELEPYRVPERLHTALSDVDDAASMKALFVDQAYEVERIEYFADHPRKSEKNQKAIRRVLTERIHEILAEAEHSIVLQSPYMVLSGKARKVFRQLRKDKPGIEFVFSTNSLASTDADTVYANTDKHKKHYVKTLGFHMYEFKPFPVDAPLFFPRWPELIAEKENGIESASVVSGDDSTIEMPAPRSGLHAKSFVVDGRIAMVGSHNFDPRSEGFNTENGLLIWDEAFAWDLEALIRRDTEPQNSWVVALKPDPNEVSGAIESVSRTLPVFDLWPYHSTTVFELAPGGEPQIPGTEAFYRNYYSVGRFPDVIRTRRQVTIMFLSSFFGFLAPVL
jgi:phosphatidylserine/phosphatidylglycerophosphate/cardiolipin synthase-like enzyme